jgi:hypothetical protein
VEEGHHDFDAPEVEEMVDSLRECVQKVQDQIFNLEFVKDMSTWQVEKWTGLNKKYFIRLASSVKLGVRRTLNTALGLYLAKLRTIDTDDSLASLFNISRPNAECLMGIARAGLERDFIPLHLGLSRLGREGLGTHPIEIAQALFAGDDVDKVLTF